MRGAETLLDFIKPDTTAFVQGCSGESKLLAELVNQPGDRLRHINFTGIQVPGVNCCDWLANDTCTFTTFFITPQLMSEDHRVRYLPYSYTDILAHFGTIAIDTALFSVSPPDKNGICSFGTTVDFLAEIWPKIPVRLAHINPLMPQTRSSHGIPVSEVVIMSEAPEPLTGVPPTTPDKIASAIAFHIQDYIQDNTTLQTGLGKLPGTVLLSLKDRKGLKIHSGLIGDEAMDLLRSGAIGNGDDICAGVAIGSPDFYEALPASGIRFEPVSHTHNPQILAGRRGLVAINSALEVDLFGQVYSERSSSGWTSGIGGLREFTRGAKAASGLRIIILPATHRYGSRIISPFEARGPVSLNRGDTDIVITEYGAADLRGLTVAERAARLISIAAPDHREALERASHEFS